MKHINEDDRIKIAKPSQDFLILSDYFEDNTSSGKPYTSLNEALDV